MSEVELVNDGSNDDLARAMILRASSSPRARRGGASCSRSSASRTWCSPRTSTNRIATAKRPPRTRSASRAKRLRRSPRRIPTRSSSPPTRSSSSTDWCSASHATKPTPSACSAMLGGQTHVVLTAVAVSYRGEHALRRRVRARHVPAAHARDASARTSRRASQWTRPARTAFRVTARRFVERIDGDYFAVMGLALTRMVGLLGRSSGCATTSVRSRYCTPA